MHSSEILLKAIMNGGKHSIIVTAPDGTVTFINNAAERLYGFEAFRFIGKPISLLRAEIYEQADLEREAVELSRELGRPVDLHDVFRLALQNHAVYERERVAIGRNGVRFHALVTISAMRDESDKLVGYLSISQDISERKRLEQLKSEFISTVSHELRTPLTSIRGALGLMVGGAVGELPKAAAEVAVIAYRNSERLIRIINDILDIEKIESGKLDFDIKELDAAALIAQSLEDNKAYGEKHGVTYVVKDASAQLKVMADSDRVMQVLANLLSNAAKFSPQGSEVHVRMVAEGGMARISVRDFGPGIPTEFQSRIFEKFAQSDATGAVRREGTGLGLSIARKLVEAMGGEISFHTRAGEGTTFAFTLPLAAPVHAVVAPAPGGRNGRILVCEDDRDVARLLLLLLERAGFAVDLVHDLAAARAKVRGGGYAALTLDLLLPDGDGLEFLSELRADPVTRELPVVVISAIAERGRSEQADHPVELVDWISKPIDETALMRALYWATRKIQREFPRILHVEDNDDLRRILQDLFEGKAEWVGAATVREARELLKREPFDLILLDIAMPDGSGLELMENSDTVSGHPVPVIILSASDTADATIRNRVAAILLKSRVSEEHIVRTVLNVARKPS